MIKLTTTQNNEFLNSFKEVNSLKEKLRQAELKNASIMSLILDAHSLDPTKQWTYKDGTLIEAVSKKTEKP